MEFSEDKRSVGHFVLIHYACTLVKDTLFRLIISLLSYNHCYAD